MRIAPPEGAIGRGLDAASVAGREAFEPRLERLDETAVAEDRGLRRAAVLQRFAVGVEDVEDELYPHARTDLVAQ